MWKLAFPNESPSSSIPVTTSRLSFLLGVFFNAQPLLSTSEHPGKGDQPKTKLSSAKVWCCVARQACATNPGAAQHYSRDDLMLFSLIHVILVTSYSHRQLVRRSSWVSGYKDCSMNKGWFGFSGDF